MGKLQGLEASLCHILGTDQEYRKVAVGPDHREQRDWPFQCKPRFERESQWKGPEFTRSL